MAGEIRRCKVQRKKLSMKSLLHSICNVMIIRSRKVPRWENMDRDILAKIFEKLNKIDIIMGASRVCISWFLVSHQKSLWRTIDLTNLKPIDLNHPQLPNLRVKNKENIVKEGLYTPWKILIEIAKFTSNNIPTNLFFNFYSYIEEDELMIASERFPNIKKLFLPRWCNISETSYRFAFSQWRNLQTLIISPLYDFNGKLKFQAVGENCINLTNLKLSGYVNAYLAAEIVIYLQNLNSLSLRCSVFSSPNVLLLITNIQTLKILNLSHCIFIERFSDPIFVVMLGNIVLRTASQRIDTLIMCLKDDCRFCQERSRPYGFYEKNLRNDEIKEFEF